MGGWWAHALGLKLSVGLTALFPSLWWIRLLSHLPFFGEAERRKGVGALGTQPREPVARASVWCAALCVAEADMWLHRCLLSVWHLRQGPRAGDLAANLTRVPRACGLET